ncbi:MAG: hypothetical protein B6242_12125 [Anaerolineaceae bacterium 4572_78]|nr:MAG: hypothetical protein B6242_12125 [Anaerolineaceae bacterium 4572_78]
MVRKLVTLDWAMKKILRDKENFDILEGLLSELLHEDIVIEEILESETNEEYEKYKFSRMDFLTKNLAGERVIIEIQYIIEHDYIQRMVHNISKVITNTIAQGQAYSNIKKVISVNILYFDFGYVEDFVYHGATHFVGMYKRDTLQLNDEQRELYQRELVAEVMPEYYVVKVRHFNDVIIDGFTEWMHFLKHGEVLDNMSAQGLAKAKEVLDIMKMDENERRAYQLHQENVRYETSMHESSYVLGELKGHEQGVEQEKLNTARRLLSMNMNIETIANATQLSVGQIMQLKSEHDKE